MSLQRNQRRTLVDAGSLLCLQHHRHDTVCPPNPSRKSCSPSQRGLLQMTCTGCGPARPAGPAGFGFRELSETSGLGWFPRTAAAVSLLRFTCCSDDESETRPTARLLVPPCVLSRSFLQPPSQQRSTRTSMSPLLQSSRSGSPH